VSSLTNIYDALEAQLSDAMSAEPRIQVVQGRAYNPSPPCIDIYAAATARDGQTAGFGDLAGGWAFTVRARVLTADFVAGHELLVRFQDDEDDLSIPQAVLEDPTLGGFATSVHMPEDGFSGDIVYSEFGTDYLGCEWRVEVIGAES
jgi:hypothetical protein